MSDDDDKVASISQNKGNDTNKKLKDDFNKEWQPKLSEQRKKTVAAIRAANNEKKALANLIEDYEEENHAFDNAIKDV